MFQTFLLDSNFQKNNISTMKIHILRILYWKDFGDLGGYKKYQNALLTVKWIPFPGFEMKKVTWLSLKKYFLQFPNQKEKNYRPSAIGFCPILVT